MRDIDEGFLAVGVLAELAGVDGLLLVVGVTQPVATLAVLYLDVLVVAAVVEDGLALVVHFVGVFDYYEGFSIALWGNWVDFGGDLADVVLL